LSPGEISVLIRAISYSFRRILFIPISQKIDQRDDGCITDGCSPIKIIVQDGCHRTCGIVPGLPTKVFQRFQCRL